MAYNNDPRPDARPPGADPRTPHQTNIHNTTPVGPPATSGSSMAFIVGGVVVAIIVLFLLFGGIFGNSRSGSGVSTTAPAGGTTNTINVEPGAAPAQQQTTPLLEQPIPGVRTESAPAAPAETAPAPAPAD